MKISIIQPSRNNLKYLKWSYASIRKNQGNHIVQICVADDNSSDGTSEWCEKMASEDDHFDYIVNDSGERLGHTILYDKLVNKVAKHEVCMIFHADMYLLPNALDSIEKHLYGTDLDNVSELIPLKKTIVSLTRIEPPLHPDGVEKLIKDFGVEPEKFDDDGLLKYYEDDLQQYKGKTTEGIFAPWAFFKSDFQEVGGHDELYRPQSKEDSIHGDTIVFVIEDRYKRFTRVNELWDKYSEYVTIREDGKEFINLSKLDIRVISPTSDGRIGKNKLNGLIRHSVESNRVVTVRDRHGIVVVTEDHSLIDRNMHEVTPSGVKGSDIELWRPSTNSFMKWARRDSLKTLTIEATDNVPVTNRNDYKFPEIKNIDEYGNNQTLMDLCEFLGFYVAEGSISKNGSIRICGNDRLELEYYADLFRQLFNAKPNKIITSRKDNHKDVYSSCWGTKYLSSIFLELIGDHSSTKKVPDFIFNLPKVYQRQFLYGYLRGDGYLGVTSTSKGYDSATSFSVDKRLLFNKKCLEIFTWKSTSKSDILTSGLVYLLMRCFPNTNYRVQFDSVREVYNLTSYGDMRKDLLEIIPFITEDDNIMMYDLDVRDSNMFVGGIGMIALHNSDIFNRFKLNDVKFIQTWDGFVYHMTCRGSRFNPTITRVGHNSEEWTRQNIKSHYNFIRKWGMPVQHDQYMNPQITPKYDVAVVLLNVGIHHQLEYLREFEVRSSVLYIDNADVVERYRFKFGDTTDMDLTERVKVMTEDDPANDVVIIVDMNKLTENEFRYFLQYPLILADSGEGGREMSLGSLYFKIRELNRIESDNIFLNK